MPSEQEDSATEQMETKETLIGLNTVYGQMSMLANSSTDSTTSVEAYRDADDVRLTAYVRDGWDDSAYARQRLSPEDARDLAEQLLAAADEVSNDG